MAHILIQQQQTILRSSGINIHRSTSMSKNDETTLPMTHSVDDRLFLCKQDSTRLLHLLTRFSSEPQISIYSSSKTQIHGNFLKDNEIRNLSKSCEKKDVDEIDFEELFLWNCDKVSTNSSAEENVLKSVNLSEDVSVLSAPIEIEHIPEQSKLEEDSNHNNNERPIRRRKRRSSITKTSPTNIEEELSDDKTFSNLMMNNLNEEKTEQDKEEEQNENETTKINRFRVRRLRHRLQQHRQTDLPTPLIEQTEVVVFKLDEEPNKTINEEPSTPSVEPTTPILSNETTPSGGLKRVNSSSTNKKNVRFADTVGLELTQVQYIHANICDEPKDFSMMLGTSLLSSSPPSFSKNSLYLPRQSNFEHKPWSFDIDLPSKQNLVEKPLPRRFFCLFRQPNSEPADVYLHEIWKYQIKLEHANISFHQSPNGEQYLIGTAWVANVGFTKYVAVKYTFNRWLNTYEHEAQYRCHSNDSRNIDQFEFHIDIPADVDRVDFVLRYSVNAHEYWDNNDGKNYTLQTENNYALQTKISLPHDCDFNEMRFY